MRTAIFLLLISALWSLQAAACRCVEPDPLRAYANADAVAVIRINEVTVLQGEVTRVTEKCSSPGSLHCHAC